MSTSKFIFGLILILIGLSILIGFSIIKFAIGAILVWIGVRLLYRGHATGHYAYGMGAPSISVESMPSEVFVFTPVNKEFQSDAFKGGKIVMVFAGGEIDLSRVKTAEKEITLELVMVFGGVKLIIPQNWKVVLEGAGIFGGYDNRTQSGSGETTLRLKGSAVFGGIEIVNPAEKD